MSCTATRFQYNRALLGSLLLYVVLTVIIISLMLFSHLYSFAVVALNIHTSWCVSYVDCCTAQATKDHIKISSLQNSYLTISDYILQKFARLHTDVSLIEENILTLVVGGNKA